jgi:hypothetical protein
MSETVELTSTNSHVLAPSSSGQDLVSLLSTDSPNHHDDRRRIERRGFADL